jgi:phosphoserine phosphatase
LSGGLDAHLRGGFLAEDAVTPRPLPDGFRSVIFDCDSTLADIEGIDELAGSRLEEIQALTASAMEGLIPLEEVYGRRLEIIRPTRERVDAIGELYVERLVPDARETIAALTWLGKDVRVISGGLLPPVLAAASALGIAKASVAAVGIDFAADGSYAGFDATSPLARSGGKLEVIRRWRLDGPALMVGDGATDLEASQGVDAFAAYMGVAFRPAIAAKADVVLRAPSLATVLALAASRADREKLAASEWGDLLQRGDELLDSLPPAASTVPVA